MEMNQNIQSVAAVRAFAAQINAELDRCDNGEGMECASLDASLEHYAARCCRLVEQIRLWGREVFSGRQPHDQAVEDAWFQAGVDLNNRAIEMLERARQVEIPCYDLPGVNKLSSSLFALYQILAGWVSPRLSVGPSARKTHEPQNRGEEVSNRGAGLKPLPADWIPTDRRQQTVYRKTNGN